jgi:hypothetical protein
MAVESITAVCIKTGCNIFLPEYNSVIRADVHSIAYCKVLIIDGFMEPVRHNLGRAQGMVDRAEMVINLYRDCYYRKHNRIIVAPVEDVFVSKEFIDYIRTHHPYTAELLEPRQIISK